MTLDGLRILHTDPSFHKESFPTVYAQPFQHSIELARTTVRPDQVLREIMRLTRFCTQLTAPVDDPGLYENLANNDVAVVMDIAGYSRHFMAGLAQTVCVLSLASAWRSH